MSFTESQVELMQGKIHVAQANALEALGHPRGEIFDLMLSDADGDWLTSELSLKIEKAEKEARRCRDALNALHATYREIAREVHEVASKE